VLIHVGLYFRKEVEAAKSAWFAVYAVNRKRQKDVLPSQIFIYADGARQNVRSFRAHNGAGPRWIYS